MTHLRATSLVWLIAVSVATQLMAVTFVLRGGGRALIVMLLLIGAVITCYVLALALDAVRRARH